MRKTGCDRAADRKQRERDKCSDSGSTRQRSEKKMCSIKIEMQRKLL